MTEQLFYLFLFLNSLNNEENTKILNAKHSHFLAQV